MLLRLQTVFLDLVLQILPQHAKIPRGLRNVSVVSHQLLPDQRFFYILQIVGELAVSRRKAMETAPIITFSNSLILPG